MAWEVGKRVFWRSQGGGTWRDKTGVVVAVVGPTQTGWQALEGAGIAARPSGWSVSRWSSRSVTPSYIIREVDTGRLYWPRTSALQEAP